MPWNAWRVRPSRASMARTSVSLHSMSANSFCTRAAESFSSWFIVGHTETSAPPPLSIRRAEGSTSHGSPRSIITASAPRTGADAPPLRSAFFCVTYLLMPARSMFLAAIFMNFSSTSNVYTRPRGFTSEARNVVIEPLPVPISTIFCPLQTPARAAI